MPRGAGETIAGCRAAVGQRHIQPRRTAHAGASTSRRLILPTRAIRAAFCIGACRVGASVTLSALYVPRARGRSAGRAPRTRGAASKCLALPSWAFRALRVRSICSPPPLVVHPNWADDTVLGTRARLVPTRGAWKLFVSAEVPLPFTVATRPAIAAVAIS